MSETRGKPKRFAGIIQGLSDEKIQDIMYMKGFRKEDYGLYKISYLEP